jgi:hypothetical protein
MGGDASNENATVPRCQSLGMMRPTNNTDQHAGLLLVMRQRKQQQSNMPIC